MEYKDLEVWQLARESVNRIHRMTLRELPKFEMFEEGAQIRRSSKSSKSNIVEGFGRRRHKGDFVRFLDYAYASCLESIDHLETLWETESLQNQDTFDELSDLLDHLARKLRRFTQSVEANHNRFCEDAPQCEA
jgi:four helix bundle protein